MLKSKELRKRENIQGAEVVSGEKESRSSVEEPNVVQVYKSKGQ